MKADTFKSKHLQAARQLPALETLCMDGLAVDVIDVTGCRHLQQLDLKGTVARQRLKSPTCSFGFDPTDSTQLDCFYEEPWSEEPWSGALRSNLGSADHATLYCLGQEDFWRSQASHGISGFSLAWRL